MVERSRTVENDRKPGKSTLTEAVARYYFKFLLTRMNMRLLAFILMVISSKK
ncbi:MAG: hypothetical protein CM1200mP28_01190 [Deltaproteobacteria bacterium]|nr:MAG: hypothetical protein CM1200mP28_01190 [Deltaproteobacteria bacterium]